MLDKDRLFNGASFDQAYFDNLILKFERFAPANGVFIKRLPIFTPPPWTMHKNPCF